MFQHSSCSVFSCIKYGDFEPWRIAGKVLIVVFAGESHILLILRSYLCVKPH